MLHFELAVEDLRDICRLEEEKRSMNGLRRGAVLCCGGVERPLGDRTEQAGLSAPPEQAAEQGPDWIGPRWPQCRQGGLRGILAQEEDYAPG